MRVKSKFQLSALFLCFALLAGAIFLILASAIAAGKLQLFDEYFLHFFRDRSTLAEGIGPAWVQEVLVEMTTLGGYPVIIMMLIVTIGLLVTTARYALALQVFLTVGLGWLLSHFLKQYYDRPRPDLVPYLDKISTASFPSGHAMMSTVLYLTLAVLVMRCFDDVRVRVYGLGLAIFLAFIIGISRIYLGVHWPSDVLAGWILGVAWVCFSWLVATALQGKHRSS